MTVAPAWEDTALATMDEVVLYDVVREAGNRLSGRLLRLQEAARAAGCGEQEAFFEQEERVVAEQMAGVWGRSDLIRRYRAWNARFAELGEL